MSVGASGRLCLAGLCVLVLFASRAVEGAVTRIMPLGDSITYGSNGGYRGPLYQQLINAGHSVDFVGSVVAGSIPDPDNEGHPGWRAEQIRDNITNWMTINPAQIVLLHIGTNDLSMGEQPVGVVNEIGQILDNIKAYATAHNTSIVVVLARIINRTDSKCDETSDLNIRIEDMAIGRILNGERLMVVNMESALSYPADLADVVHPNASGYGKMATVWFNALNSLFCTKSDYVRLPAPLRVG